MKKFILLLLLLLTLSSLLSCTDEDAKIETSSATFQEQTEAATVPITEMKYVASRESNKYHRKRCHYVDNIKESNKVYYSTEEEALADGKTPCSVCSP